MTFTHSFEDPTNGSISSTDQNVTVGNNREEFQSESFDYCHVWGHFETLGEKKDDKVSFKGRALHQYNLDL